MSLPRLVIADEIQAGIVPPSLTLVYALKRSGINIKVFTCSRSDADVRLLKTLLGETVISLDPYACGSVKNFKTLFQKIASPDALNVVLVPIGVRQEEDFIQVGPEVTELVKALDCGVVPVIAASASTVLTTRAAMSVVSALEKSCEGAVLGVIFTSVKNPREYQLLEQEYGRSTHILSLGYMPKEIERSMPSLLDLYNNAAGVMQIKSAALQFISMSYHIEWEILDAFGQLKKTWIPPETLYYAPKNFKIAVVGNQSLSLEGDNCCELFRHLGCGVVDYNPWREPFPKDVEAIYFPHSAGNLYGDRLIAHEPFCQGIRQSFAANKLILVNGASAPLFGHHFITPDGEKHEGLGFFKLRGNYTSTKTGGGGKKIEIRATDDSFLSKRDEKMRGYALDYLSISNPGNVVPPVWAYRDLRKDTELGVSGWVNGYCFVTDLYMELWSNVEIINRWLSLRKR